MLNCNLRFAISEFAPSFFESLMFNHPSLILIKIEFVCKYRNFFVTLHTEKEKNAQNA